MANKKTSMKGLTVEEREQYKKDFDDKEKFKEHFKKVCEELKTNLEKRKEVLEKQEDPAEEIRDWAWEHCKKAFDDVFSKNENDKDDIDYLALHLMCYLGNWGMLRGSSKLPSCNYKALKPMVREILETGALLHGKDLKDFSEKDALDDFESLRKKINDHCKKLLRPEDNNNDVSGTLVSKIMLGTMGFVPAYDKNVKGILSYLKTHFYKSVNPVIKHKKENENWEGVDSRSTFGGNFNKGSVASLACLFAGEDDFAKEIIKITGKIKAINPCYTLARVVDYAMWYLYDKLPTKEDKNGK